MFFTKIWLVTSTWIMKYESWVVKSNSAIFLILQIICKKIKMSMFLVYPGPLEVDYKQCMLIWFHYNQSLISSQYSLHEVFTILKTTYSYSLSNSIIFYTKFQPYLCYKAIIGRYEVALWIFSRMLFCVELSSFFSKLKGHILDGFCSSLKTC